MKYPTRPIQAVFKKRPNKFLGIVELKGKETSCFIPNPGRMNELMVPGTKVYLLQKEIGNRKTRYDMILMHYQSTLVSIDSRYPQKLLAEAIEQKKLDQFQGYSVERTEPTFNGSRLDLKLSKQNQQILIECKSCTLVEKGTALFPDAPTKRGARHMATLTKAIEHGRAAVTFIIQRDDAQRFTPNTKMDPNFAKAIAVANQNGVEVYAYTCFVSLEEIYINRRIPVIL
jgi:sugar fermentation stimulation protein A